MDDNDDDADDDDDEEEEEEKDDFNLLPLTVDCERCDSNVRLPPHQLANHP